MKIGLFTDTYFPQINGVATSVLMLKESLEIQGHDVYIFTTTNPDSPTIERGVYRIPSVPLSNMDRRVSTVVYPRLAKTVKGLGLDLIHTHTEFSLGILGHRMARTMQIPLVHTMHTKYEDYTHYIVRAKSLTSITNAIARKITASFCNSADKVIAPTNKTKELLLSYGVSRDISIIPTGIWLDKFSKACCPADKVMEIRDKLHLDKNDKVVINIGRISPEKDLGEILYALKNYLPEHRDIKLVLVGDGPEKSKLETLAIELGISKQTIFAGEQQWDDIGLYYQLGDVFVSASQSETQGLTYIESLSAGLPILAKADSCLEGVIQNGVNGYIFNNEKQFISSLNRILYDRQHHDYLSEEAINSSQKYSAAHYAGSVALLYESVLRQYNVSWRFSA